MVYIGGNSLPPASRSRFAICHDGLERESRYRRCRVEKYSKEVALWSGLAATLELCPFRLDVATRIPALFEPFQYALSTAEQSLLQKSRW